MITIKLCECPRSPKEKKREKRIMRITNWEEVEVAAEPVLIWGMDLQEEYKAKDDSAEGFVLEEQREDPDSGDTIERFRQVVG